MNRSPTRTQQAHPLLQGFIATWHSRPGGAWSALPDAPVVADEPPRWTSTSKLLNRIRSRAWTRAENATDHDRDAVPGQSRRALVTGDDLHEHTAGVGCDHRTGAPAQDRVVISNDTEFEPLLAVRRRTKPSFIIRSSDQLTADDIVRTLLRNLDTIAAELEAGAIVTVDRGHLRARRQQPPR